MAFASVTFRGSTLPEKKPIAYHGNPQDFRRFKTRQKAKAYVAQQVTLGQTPLSSPDAVFYTDGSALLASRTAEWGVYLNRACAFPVSLWGPVVTDPSEPACIGPSVRPTTQVKSVLFTIPTSGFVPRMGPPSSIRRRLNSIADSECYLRLFGDNSIKDRCNKAIIQHVRRLLQEVRAHHDIAISWIKAHTGASSPDARGRSGSLSEVDGSPAPLRRPRLHRDSTPSDPPRP